MLLALATRSNLPDWEVDDRHLHAALDGLGLPFERPVWDDPAVDWARYDAVLLRTPWDYQDKLPAFMAWVRRVTDVTRLFNPAPVVAWNVHKHYLRDLERHGVPIAPTVWLDRGMRADVAAIVRARGWSAGFLKPCVGATARETLRFRADAGGLADAQQHVDRLLPHEDLILQPYLRSVETRGEWSAVFFDGRLSHCVRKVPVPGDYRVQDDYGASDGPYAPSAAELDLAHRAVAVLSDPRGPCPAGGVPLLYGRTDFLWQDDGSCVLTELEVVEPSLFFRHRPEAGLDLARALLARF